MLNTAVSKVSGSHIELGLKEGLKARDRGRVRLGSQLLQSALNAFLYH